MNYISGNIKNQLDPIFKPASIAIIGASNTPNKWGFMMVTRPLSTGYDGAIYPINPKEKEVLGLRAYPNVLDVPGPIDLAIITIPAAKVPGALRECVKKGIKGAVIITAGFAETGDEGKALQDEISQIAKTEGIRLVGPNCMGISSAAGNLNTCFSKMPDPGGISFISQSGTYGIFLSEIANSKGYGLSKFISIGNQADLTASDYLEYLAEDNETKIIVLYIEGFEDGRRFFKLAKEVIKKKPVIIYKGGKTDAGARATLSHTASLAGSEEIFDSMCRQSGIIRAQEALQSFEMAEALVHQPLPRGRRVALMGSGGQCVVTSDACALLGLEIPEFDTGTIQYLHELLPAHAPPAKNPVDFAGAFRAMSTEVAVVEKFLTLDYIDAVVTRIPSTWNQKGATIGPTDLSSISKEDIEASEYFSSLPQKYNKPIVTVKFGSMINSTVENIIRKAGIPIYETPEQCARAIYALVNYSEALESY